jgi:hypothetical protein
MNTSEYLQKTFANIHVVFQDILADVSEAEWVTRPTPGLNMLGYIAWHVPRTQDSFVQTWIRGVPEVAHSDRWSSWRSLKRLGIGVGITLDEADEIARCTGRADVLDYASTVHEEISAWLGISSESEFERVADTRGHLSAFPEYLTPGFAEETKNLHDLPAWGILMRPCIGHIHRHLGELEVAKQIVRAKA